MNNSVFGKTMENLHERVDVRLVTNEKKLDKLTSKPTFVSSKIFNKNLMAIHKVKEMLNLNIPSYVGMCIIDLSKMLMYDFHYNYIKKKYGDRARLLFTDTDSLTYEIEAEDVYKDFWNDKDMFDNSNYPENSMPIKRSSAFSKMKLVAFLLPNSFFLSLKCTLMLKTIKKVEGPEDYENTLINNEQMHHKMKTIRSQRHQLGSYEINKVLLSCLNDKRYIHGMSSYVYGHYKIK